MGTRREAVVDFTAPGHGRPWVPDFTWGAPRLCVVGPQQTREPAASAIPEKLIVPADGAFIKPGDSGFRAQAQVLSERSLIPGKVWGPQG